MDRSRDPAGVAAASKRGSDLDDGCASSSPSMRSPSDHVGIVVRASRADSTFQHTAQRIPRSRFATIASPFPDPPSTTPRSHSPRATASAARRMKAG
jgi:hypothetical protein